MSTIFISYRRDDSSYPSQLIASGLVARFPDHEIFIDTDSIRAGKDIRKLIRDALARADVLISVIGPHWLTLADANGAPRLQQRDDWVASEIRHFLSNGKPIVPVTVGNASPRIEIQLPASIQKFASMRSIPIRADFWVQDLENLSSELERLGIKRAAAAGSQSVRLPTPDDKKRRVNSFGDAELARHLDALPGWRRVEFKPPKADVPAGTAIVRSFEFASFRDAMHFMSNGARFVDQLDHHPVWENVWRTVTVRLTTFDIGFKPSIYDLTVARYLNGIFAEYVGGPQTASEKLLAEALGQLSQ